MALTSEQLHDLAFSVTPEIVKTYPHMIDLWRAMLGGYVLPEIAKSEPEMVAGNEKFEALIKEFSKDKIKKMFSKVEIKEVIKKAEVPKIVERTVVVSSGEKVVHRRLKSEVHKIKRKKRQLQPHERDMIISVFNDRQDMLDKTSEVCKNLIDAVNDKRDPEDHISAPQLAGYWSSLCRWGLQPKAKRDEWIKKSLKKKTPTFSVAPWYSDSFVAKIRENYRKRKEEASERVKDHAEIKRTGRRKKVIISEVPTTEIPIDKLPASSLADFS